MIDSSNFTEQDQCLLLRENGQLEHIYLRKADPSVALLLTRNYNLLTQQQSLIEQRQNFLQKTKFWWQRYLKLSTGKTLSFRFDPFYKRPLFKSISIRGDSSCQHHVN